MRGRLLRRYKRFLVDIETETGDVVTAFCPATGRMRTCDKIGAPVEFYRVNNPDRRTDYDWWSIRMPASWVVIDTRPANELVSGHRDRSFFPESWSTARWQAEPTLEDGGRLDFLIDTAPARTWVEVKSVTWCEEGIGYFPDAPSERASRHLRELMEKAQTARAALVLMSMRSDVTEIRPARRVDPNFAQLIREARRSGVELIGIRSKVTSWDINPVERIPVIVEM